MQSLKIPKTSLRGCRVLCVPVWACVCVRHHHHIASYHRIIPHNITSYIISHQQQKEWVRSRSSAKICWMKMCRSTKQTFGRYNIIATDSPLKMAFLYKAWKERKMFFRRRLKNSMCVNFMHRKEIYYNNLYVWLIVPYTKCYIISLQ
jgi:hypothetical protein